MGYLSSQSKPTKNESIKESQVRAVKVRLGLIFIRLLIKANKIRTAVEFGPDLAYVANRKISSGCRGTVEITYPQFWLSIKSVPELVRCPSLSLSDTKIKFLQSRTRTRILKQDKIRRRPSNSGLFQNLTK